MTFLYFHSFRKQVNQTTIHSYIPMLTFFLSSKMLFDTKGDWRMGERTAPNKQTNCCVQLLCVLWNKCVFFYQKCVKKCVLPPGLILLKFGLVGSD